jgi:hypothetical protein
MILQSILNTAFKALPLQKPRNPEPPLFIPMETKRAMIKSEFIKKNVSTMEQLYGKGLEEEYLFITRTTTVPRP